MADSVPVPPVESDYEKRAKAAQAELNKICEQYGVKIMAKAYLDVKAQGIRPVSEVIWVDVKPEAISDK